MTQSPPLTLCDLADIPAGQGRSFDVKTDAGTDMALLVVNDQGEPRVYLDRCSHFGIRLGVTDDYRYVDEGAIVCQTHYARYGIGDGSCLSGDCYGEGLIAVAAKLNEQGKVTIRPEDVPEPI
jgi:nitrite reductase/ring-hydroxylating ferredoxin subunit